MRDQYLPESMIWEGGHFELKELNQFKVLFILNSRSGIAIEGTGTIDRYLYFQRTESPTHNIPTPTPAPAHVLGDTSAVSL